MVNRLHRLLRELRPGGGPSRLSADRAQALLRRLRPTGAADRERLRMARELVREVRVLDRNLVANGRRLEAALRVQGSALTRIPGVGVILAAKIVGRSGAVSRFPSRAHYASYTGTAPLEVSSGEVQRHRLSRGGDRQLNRALHIAALTQARMPGTEGHGYFRRKLAAGKSRNEALRCLKRRLSDVVYRCMVADCSHLRYRGRLTQRLRPTRGQRTSSCVRKRARAVTEHALAASWHVGEPVGAGRRDSNPRPSAWEARWSASGCGSERTRCEPARKPDFSGGGVVSPRPLERSKSRRPGSVGVTS